MPDDVLVCPYTGDFCVEDVVVKKVRSPDPRWRWTLDLANAILYTCLDPPTLNCVLELCRQCPVMGPSPRLD
jgi:hypothetical protein